MPKYNRTLFACYFGFISQAIINNLLPLLFVTLQDLFTLSVTQIGFMVTYNFAVQIVVDLFAVKYADRIGYRACMVTAHVFCAVGLAGLAIFPFLLPTPYYGVLLAITIYAAGGGLIEVLASPIVQALPLKRKESVMNILHSFYCWGHAGVVILTTLFFLVAGTGNWRLICLLWAAVPAANIILCAVCPLCPLTPEGEAITVKNLFTIKLFWLFILLMICSGAAEQAMSQWSSFFAETGLRVSKTMGDLLGPCMFAILMGTARAVFGAFGHRFPLKKALIGTGILCVCSYLIAVFSPLPVVSLIGCGFCGISVGIMWPGVLNMSAKYFPMGGTAMFGLLAVAGDIGCSVGPFTVSCFTDLFNGQLKAGLLAATLFPLVLALVIFGLSKAK